jgi:hypothetical protein
MPATHEERTQMMFFVGAALVKQNRLGKMKEV